MAREDRSDQCGLFLRISAVVLYLGQILPEPGITALYFFRILPRAGYGSINKPDYA